MKLLRRDLNGMMLPGAPLPMAERILAGKPDGSRLLITAMNGADLFIKENGTIRVSTAKEFAALSKRPGPTTGSRRRTPRRRPTGTPSGRTCG